MSKESEMDASTAYSPPSSTSPNAAADNLSPVPSPSGRLNVLWSFFFLRLLFTSNESAEIVCDGSVDDGKNEADDGVEGTGGAIDPLSMLITPEILPRLLKVSTCCSFRRISPDTHGNCVCA